MRARADERASAVSKGGRVKPGAGPTTRPPQRKPARAPGDRRSLAPGLSAKTVFSAIAGSRCYLRDLVKAAAIVDDVS